MNTSDRAGVELLELTELSTRSGEFLRSPEMLLGEARVSKLASLLSSPMSRPAKPQQILLLKTLDSMSSMVVLAFLGLVEVRVRNDDTAIDCASLEADGKGGV